MHSTLITKPDKESPVKNILVALLVLAPWLTNAFPVNTNKFTGKAIDSTPAGFDAVLWNWSGYDDQELTFEFSDVVYSNAGVRLSYPVRGANYLDMSSPWGHGSVSQTTVVTIINEVFTNCYGRVPGTTNYYASYSNGVIETKSYDPPLHFEDVVYPTLTVVQGSNAVNTASIVPACIVYTATNSTMYVPDYGVTTNNWIGSTSVVTNTYSYYVKNEVIYDPNLSTTQLWSYIGFTWGSLWPSGYAESNGWFYASGAGMTEKKIISQRTKPVYTNFIGSYPQSYYVDIEYDIGWVYFQTNSTAQTNEIIIVFSGTTNTSTGTINPYYGGGTSYQYTRFYASNTNLNGDNSFSFSFAATTNLNIYVRKISITPQGYAFVSNGVQTVTTNYVSSSNKVSMLVPGYTRINSGYSSNSVLYSKYTLTVPRTNIPPDGMYYMEVLAYDNQTNQTRSLLKGQVTVSHSLYSNTNLASWVSTAMGKYSYLNGIYGAGWINGGTGITVTTSGSNITIALGALTNYVAKTGDLLSGNLDFTNAGLTSLDFATFDTAPTGAINAARLQWNSARDTLRLGLNANVNLDVGQQLMLYAKNADTNTVAKGEVVIVSGSQGDNPTIKRASNASEITSARTIGVAAESITVNNNGLVVTRGTIYGINTTNFTAGDVLYLGPNGTMQTNLPEAPLHGVQIGTVERSHQNAGQIYVSIHNYNELDELSDVHIPSPTNLNVLTWIAASNRWEARAAAASVDLFSGQDTTGTITSTSSDSGKYLKADGSWDTPPDTTGFVNPAIAALEMGVFPITLSQAIPNSPGIASLSLSITNIDSDPWPIIKLFGGGTVITTQYVDFGLGGKAPEPSNGYALVYSASDTTWRAQAVASGVNLSALSNGLISVGLTASNAYARGDTSGLNWAAISNAPANITTQGTITAASIGAVPNTMTTNTVPLFWNSSVPATTNDFIGFTYGSTLTTRSAGTNYTFATFVNAATNVYTATASADFSWPLLPTTVTSIELHHACISSANASLVYEFANTDRGWSYITTQTVANTGLNITTNLTISGTALTNAAPGQLWSVKVTGSGGCTNTANPAFFGPRTLIKVIGQ